MTLTIGSLFAGIGGFDLGFERAGFKTVWQCEIDKAAQGVLRRWFPDAALHSDVCEVGAHNLEPVDVVTYGFPCTDISQAGSAWGVRTGLDGKRSALFHEAIRVIQELRERYGKPDFAIAENVAGLFSSGGGKDFRAVLSALLDSGARDIAWRVLDSQGAGVPQRRRRVFIVADFAGNRAAQVLFERQGSSGGVISGRETKASPTAVAGSGATENYFRILKSGIYAESRHSSTLAARDYKSPTDLVIEDGAPRRLTPVEHERLQAFPDNWTDGQTDGHRYKQLGNAVTVNVAEWIAKRLADSMQPPKETTNG